MTKQETAAMPLNQVDKMLYEELDQEQTLLPAF